MAAIERHWLDVMSRDTDCLNAERDVVEVSAANAALKSEGMMTKFETLCELLPADVRWGDPITPQIVEEIVLAERERICEAIKAEDDHCADGDYMMDSDDCIKVVRGTWDRPDWNGSNAGIEAP